MIDIIYAEEVYDVCLKKLHRFGMLAVQSGLGSIKTAQNESRFCGF